MKGTISEKILARASNKKEVSPGDIVVAEVDIVMINDITGPPAINAFRSIGKPIWDRNKIVMVIDHIVPPSSEHAARLHREMKNFAREEEIPHYYDSAGICHQILPEKGHVAPGNLIVGADSHTCTYGAFGAFATGIGSTEAAAVFATGKIWLRVPETIEIKIEGTLKDMVTPKDVILNILGEIKADGASYKAIEFRGNTVKDMSISGRMTLCNMAVEMGAKVGLIEPDKKTEEFLKDRNVEFKHIKSEGKYEQTYNFEVSDLEPQVAKPHRVDDVTSVSEVEGMEIDQGFIGTCTNGRLEDLKQAAMILKNQKVDENCRLIVIPASIEVYNQALNQGLINIFLKSGAIVCHPNCGPCLGSHEGVLSEGEVCISSSNRNFPGRMGSREAKIYLASPVTVAASAIKGKITDPREMYSRGI
ncbi:MAG: homoaconitase large subunit [Candidatus Hydrothermarchaeota archaeon]